MGEVEARGRGAEEEEEETSTEEKEGEVWAGGGFFRAVSALILTSRSCVDATTRFPMMASRTRASSSGRGV